MTSVVTFPRRDAFLLAVEADENGNESFLLDYQSAETHRIRIGEFASMIELSEAMDAFIGIERKGGAA